MAAAKITTKELFRAGQPITSVFNIRGDSEDNVSAAFAYALATSHVLQRLVLADIDPTLPGHKDSISVRMQEQHGHYGITDIEVHVPDTVFIIFEAKLGTEYPSLEQMEKYAMVAQNSGFPKQWLISLSNENPNLRPIPPEWSKIIIPTDARSWRWLRNLAKQAYSKERSIIIKFTLKELQVLLEEIMGLERVNSNLVYVVSLGKDKPENWQLSWIDVVEKHSYYFYPYNHKRWPSSPPNYVGFRYRGLLQSIRHVDSFEMVEDLNRHFHEAESESLKGPHFLLKLGAPIRPDHEVRTGPRIVQSNRVWCEIDALLTCKTITDALEVTERRRKAAEK